MNNIGPITIKELSTIEQMHYAYPLVAQVYPDLTLENYYYHLDEMIKTNNYKMVAAFSGDKLVGVCGYWVLVMLYCGRYLQSSNLIVDQNLRGKKIGTKILRYLESKAKNLKCQKIVLDSYTENKKSHSLYYREDYYIRGFHFMKDLDNVS